MVYNRFDPSKNYKELQFHDSRFIQAAEQNEMQSYLREDINTLSGSIFEQGGILEGGNIVVSDNKAIIETSTIFHKGYTVYVEGKTFDIAQNGTVIIGSAIKKDVVTHNEDIELLNPAVGTAGFQDIGADRLRVTGRWCLEGEYLSDETFYLTFTFIDGVLQSVKKIAPELEGARKIMARYDYDSNGSYVVDGLLTSFDRNDESSQEHLLSISEGIAHVHGNELIFEYDQKARVAYALTTNEVIAEPYTFSGDGSYTLRHTPIASIDRIIGVKESTEDITHGGYSGVRDVLPSSPVVDIQEIYQGETVYTAGVDFVQDGDGIDWSLIGAEPAPGSSYTVSYRYQEHFEDLEHGLETFSLTGLSVGSQFLVNYKHYLRRKDILVLTKDGTFSVVQGEPREFDPYAPKQSTGLSLATIEVAYGEEPNIALEYNRTFKMKDIQTLFNKVDTINYNIAKLSLDHDARSIDPTLDKKEVFVDPLIDDDLRDMGVEQNAIIADGSMFPNIDFSQHHFLLNKDLFLDVQSLQVVAEQKARTKSRKINEYIAATVPTNHIELSPSTFRWIASSRRVQTTGRSSTTTSVITSSEIVPQTTISIDAGTFTDEIVEIYVDERKVGEFQTIATEVEENYKLQCSVTTPLGMRSGNKLVKLVGKTSGINIESVWASVPLVRTTFVRVVPVRRRWRDPLAETLLFGEDNFSMGVELYVEKLPLTDVTLSIVKTTTGLPDMHQLVYSQTFAKDALELGWRMFAFKRPVLLEAGVEYALIVECNDATGELGVAKLGAFDIEGQKWLHAQPYDGVLLSSSNSSSWTILQKEDLSFSLKQGLFALEKELLIGELEVEDATDLFLMAGVEQYLGTSVGFRATLLDRDNELVQLSPYNLASFKKYTGRVNVVAYLRTSNQNHTPLVNKDITLGVGRVSENSNYISRSFSFSGSSIDVYLDIQEVGESVSVFVEVDGVFIELSRDNSKSQFIGDGWVETCFVGDNLEMESTRIKVELLSQDVNRPEVKNLRGIVS